jgi:hypothetical protein
MKQYESYMTRRLPLGLLVYASGPKQGQPLWPNDAATARLCAIRDLMRMEMPDRLYDVTDPPIPLPNAAVMIGGQLLQASVPRPALSQMILNRLTSSPPAQSDLNGQAELLYMIVSMGSPEAMEQFSPSEIGVPSNDGYPTFLDGWGQPIFFLRWAPGFSPYSDIQFANPQPITDPATGLVKVQGSHDPFDTSNVEQNAYKLVPLVYSAGKSGGITSSYGLLVQSNYHYGNSSNQPIGMMFSNTGTSAFLQIGQPYATNQTGFITNQHLEAR